MEADAAQRERNAQDVVVKKGLASMMFVELLFWKNARDCEEVREEYGWKVPPAAVNAEAGEHSVFACC